MTGRTVLASVSVIPNLTSPDLGQQIFPKHTQFLGSKKHKANNVIITLGIKKSLKIYLPLIVYVCQVETIAGSNGGQERKVDPPGLCLLEIGAGNGQHDLLVAQLYFRPLNSNFIVTFLLSTSLHPSFHLLPLFLQELLMKYIVDSDSCFILLQWTDKQHVSCSQELFTNCTFPQTLCLRISELFINSKTIKTHNALHCAILQRQKVKSLWT